MTTFTKFGVRHRLFRTGESRWSSGKVHLQRWSREHRQWVLLCRPNDVGMFSGYHGAEVEGGDPLPEVTCKSCAKRDPRR